MFNKLFKGKTPKSVLTYDEYINVWESEIKKAERNESDTVDKTRHNYKVLNKQRSNRIHKTYKVSEELNSLLTSINSPQNWVVLTENWCGDSAQNLPYIAEMSKLNNNIDLKILPRDENLEIMDQYLTNGTSRSIPKLIAFDKDGNEIFQWGPRQKEAQSLLANELAKGREKQDVLKDLHLWYGRDRGKSIEVEFKEILQSIS